MDKIGNKLDKLIKELEPNKASNGFEKIKQYINNRLCLMFSIPPKAPKAPDDLKIAKKVNNIIISRDRCD